MTFFSHSNLSSRRSFLKTSSLLAASAALPRGLFSQQPDDSAKIEQVRKLLTAPLKLSPVATNFSMLSGTGGNIGILTGPDGKLVVDSGLSNSTTGVLQTISGMNAQPLKYLINTHFHFDHTEGNEGFHAAGATIVAHSKTRQRLSTPQFVGALQLHFPAAAAGALPSRTFTDEATFYSNGNEILLQHVNPAHTDTDIFVYFKEADVIHCGDLFFNGIYPVIDFTNGGNINGTIDATSTILAVAKDSTKIIPGHGALGSKKDLAAYHDMLVTVRDRVAAAKKSGKTLEETIAAKPTADLDAVWGNGLVKGDTIVTLVYSTL